MQSFDREMIVQAKRLEVEEEIRHRIDALMREELDNLKIVRQKIEALDRAFRDHSSLLA